MSRVCLWMFLLSLGAAAARSDTPTETRKAIQAQYDKMGAAFGKKDDIGIVAFYAPDAKIINTDGTQQTVAQAMRELKGSLAQMSELTVRLTAQSVTVKGAEAVVRVGIRWDGAFKGLAGQSQKLRAEQAGRDTWVKTDKGWKIRLAESLKEKTWLDGQVVEDNEARPALPAAERAALLADLRRWIFPVMTLQTGRGFDDLRPLNRLIGDARIVALGEASHGTAEFFQMKHRLLEFLVEKMGFTVFAIEANWPESQTADRYIKTGEGDAAFALRAMYFWTWQTEEVRDMIEWMRAYNRRPGKHPVLTFTSFDMQFPNVAASHVVDYLGRADKAEQETVRKLYEGVEKLGGQSGMQMTKADKERLRDNAAEVLKRLDARREALTKGTPPDAFREARQCARIVQQAGEMFAGNLYSVRDRAMAENVKWLVEEAYPGQKIVLWAHNGHVSTWGHGATKSMGMHLRQMFGKEMVVFGFSSDHGQIRAIRMKEGKMVPGGPTPMNLPPARRGSTEALFREAGLPRFILGFKGIPADGALGKWLAQPQPLRQPGAAYDPDNDSQMYAPLVLPKTFDAIIFLAESSAAKGLPLIRKDK